MKLLNNFTPDIAGSPANTPDIAGKASPDWIDFDRIDGGRA
jgi:hypothetical protein